MVIQLKDRQNYQGWQGCQMGRTWYWQQEFPPALSLHFCTEALTLVHPGVPKLLELHEPDAWGTLCSSIPLISPCAVHFHFPSFNLSTAQICLFSTAHDCGLAERQQRGRNCFLLSSNHVPTDMLWFESEVLFLVQPYCSFSVKITQTVAMATSKQCQWENFRENRWSRATLAVCPLIQQFHTWAGAFPQPAVLPHIPISFASVFPK